MESQIDKFLADEFESNLVPTISAFVTIPNLSSNFDSENYTNGLQEKACDFCIDWANKQGI
jgi:hypothetical protein